jgi:ATP-dependent Clp protease ATP-binding subunit ClpA
LERIGVEVDAVARDVDRTLSAACTEIQQQGPPKLQTLPSGQRVAVVDFHAPLAPLLAAAEHEALGLGHNWVGSEHLVLAVIRLADPRLRRVLEQHRVVYDSVLESVRDILRSW